MKKLTNFFHLIACFILVISMTIFPVNALTYVSVYSGSRETVGEGDPINILFDDGTDLLAYLKYIDTYYTIDGVYVYEVSEEGSSDKIDYWNQYFDSIYPGQRLRSATYKYNCHSYAWYSQSASNNYWMDTPSRFYSDGSYTEVSSPSVGDIICYFDDMGTTTTSDDVNLHSGIVTEVLSGTSNGECGNSDLVMVTSKWEYGGLYLHNGYECPYTSYHNGTGDYVKYYRHFHNYTDAVVNYSSSFHKEYCACGDYMLNYHDYTYSYAPATSDNYHLAYCECGEYVEEPHSLEPMAGDPSKYICDCGMIMEINK